MEIMEPSWKFISIVLLKGARSDHLRFFKFSEILESEESLYFSHYPWWILLLENVPFGRYNENVTGNHNMRLTQ